MFRGVGLWTSDLSPVLRAGSLRTAGAETLGGEENENERSAAVREVEEECGIVGPVIIDELPSTFHTYIAIIILIFTITLYYHKRKKA